MAVIRVGVFHECLSLPGIYTWESRLDVPFLHQASPNPSLPFQSLPGHLVFKVKASTAVQPKPPGLGCHERNEGPWTSMRNLQLSVSSNTRNQNLRLPIALPSRQTSYCPTDVKHTKAPRCYVLYTNELERTIHHNCWLFHSGLNTASGIPAKTCTLPS